MRQHRSETFVKPMRESEWRALQYRNAITEDKIAVRNLQVTVNAGQDAWGRQKTQPALITVILSLANSFNSAAAADALDASTIHYGQLSKAIKAGVENIPQHFRTDQLASRIGSCIFEAAGATDLHAYEIEIFFPKGSLLGDGAGWSYSELEVPRHGRFSTETLHLRNVRIPCIIGINANEREHIQPVVVNLWLEHMATHLSEDYPRIEATVVNAISGSSFETLETLSEKVVDELRVDYFASEPEYNEVSIRLRVEKPMAVPFAEAPSIEIVRPVRTE